MGNKSVSTAATLWGATRIEDRTGWKATCSSSSSNDPATSCDKAIDALGNATDWKSANGTVHWIVIDLAQEVNIHSLAVTPSKSWEAAGGSVRQHQVEVRTQTGDWQPVAFGAWRNGSIVTAATFEPRLAQFVRLSVRDTHKDANFVAISDINVYTLSAVPAAVAGGGRWNYTLNFPLVPVTAFLNPITRQLVTLASYAPDRFENDKHHNTVLATWDPASGNITDELIGQTKHDIFCPGTSMDESGQLIVTGGSTAAVFSIYNPSPSRGWEMPKHNRVAVPRGYQGQTYLSDGRTFMIGGTWSGGGADENKNGEIYDPKTGTWTKLPGIAADYIKMNASQTCSPPGSSKPCFMDEWRQHHAWLFAWKDGSVFHAGPSVRMNWFFLTAAPGKVELGGYRKDTSKDFADGDAVCGAAVMYDAVNGRILTAGGAPNYHYWHDSSKMPAGAHRLEATTNVFNITLGAPGRVVEPTQLASMKRQRIFANAAVLPNGEVFIVGGQRQGEPFYDETWQPVPEIYTPQTNSWRDAAPHSTPRVYHSWAMLLPDASVLVGGGGLQRPETDHYDAQVYQPSYLLTPDGKDTIPDTQRPAIKDDGVTEYKVGDAVSIATDVDVDDASLIRYSAATHALNNDLRRIQLTLRGSGKNYTAAIPSDPGVALPGYWMLFVLRKGVPSHAKTIRIHT
ncbi:bleached galactose oxidase [Lasiosphaeria ovina]|uniref:Bleached galactose oxidase n=1 Tax=Lasiosphaeria ovina TaxID=92902 RepID=A0AAE0KCK0_9PEZI|nr:bleached galactose oxidase [Lasiosphaeria ovina]